MKSPATRITLSGQRNARDLGGIVSADGRRIRAGKFIRSAALDNLRASDVEVLLDKYHVNTIIDLRTNQEQRERPDTHLPGATYYSLPPLAEAALGITRETGVNPTRVLRQGFTPEELSEFLPDLSELYANFVTVPHSVEQLRAIMQVLVHQSEIDGACIYHCTAGKDRTGVVSALLLEALGVPRESIMADYVLTNMVAKHDANKYHLLIGVLLRSKEAAATMRHVFLAEEKYLQAMYDAIDATYGSVNVFLSEQMGLDDAACAALRDRLLV